jgi:DNA-binding response OmpR family regulator
METAMRDQVLRSGSIEIRPAEFLALAGGRPLNLTARELDLLTALVLRHGRIVSREELYGEVWDEPYRKSDRSVDVYVAKLRQKLDAALPGVRFIHTHFGFGYRLEQEHQRLSEGGRESPAERFPSEAGDSRPPSLAPPSQRFHIRETSP